MAVYEMKAELRLGAVPMIEERLSEFEEPRVMVLEDKPSGRAWLTGYFESPAAATEVWVRCTALIEEEWFVAKSTLAELADKDWKESYKEHFRAWRFGPLHWVPVWERERFELPRGEKVLWLDPGMAFGTGNHETTRLVVERLVERALSKGVDERVIDAGCGSGILALSAVVLGYRQVAAFDNDPLAVAVSKDNAELNGASGSVDFYAGDLVTGLAGRQADVVLANIQADVLMKYGRELIAGVASGGVLILSGILTAELSQVRDTFIALAPNGKLESRSLGEWSDLLVSRSAFSE